jgi:hypothetical protein
MRIENFDRRSVGDRSRIEARFIYEDVDLPPITIFYEAGPPLGDALEATPEAFVLPGFPIAVWEGERRLKVEGALDTTLAGGLGRAGNLLSSWYENCGSVSLEPTDGFRAVSPASGQHSAALFTGGVDAMAMLCENRRLVPLDHPRSIRTLVYAFGYSFLDRPEGVESPRMRARYEAQARRLEEMGERVGFTLVRLDTNVRRLDPKRDPFYFAAHSGAFMAPLVAAPRYVSDAFIASAGQGGAVQSPHGSHPMLDPYYSTSAVRVHHAQPQVGRIEKLAMIADWEPAYDTLQVCHGGLAPPPETVNCGTCEKCVRTRVALLALEALPRFNTFPEGDVTPETVRRVQLSHVGSYLAEPALRERLKQLGRGDLVRAIRFLVAKRHVQNLVDKILPYVSKS